MRNRYKDTVFARCREMQNSRSALRRRLGFYWERKFQENFARAFVMNVVLVIVIQVGARLLAHKVTNVIFERMERREERQHAQLMAEEDARWDDLEQYHDELDAERAANFGHVDEDYEPF